MRMRSITILAAVLGAAPFGVRKWRSAAEIKVLSSQAIKEAYLAFAPEFERVSGHKLNTTWNGTVDILKKLRAGETFDMVIMVTPAMETMIKEGKIVGASRVDLVRSGIAIAVPAGAPKPDISSTDAVKRALLAAKGIGYSSGPSGVFMEGLFKKWGIWDQVSGEDQADAARHAGRLDPRARRRRHRLPAGQRAPALSRHPVCRSGAEGDGHRQRLRRRRAHRRDAAGRGARADQVHQLAGGGCPTSRRPAWSKARHDRPPATAGNARRSRRGLAPSIIGRAHKLGANLSEPLRAPDRTAGTRRTDRRRRPRHGRAAVENVGPAGRDRKPAGRRHQHRGRAGRKSAPDGHSILYATSSLAVAPSLYRTLGYDPLTDLAPVANLFSFPYYMQLPKFPPPGSTIDLSVGSELAFQCTIARADWHEEKQRFVLACKYPKQRIFPHEYEALLNDPQWERTEYPA